jgi:predicted CxxxxCH...CXXCH cytochrome family protein
MVKRTIDNTGLIMKYIVYNFITAFTLVVLIIGCSDVKENAITNQQENDNRLIVHPKGFAIPGNTNFHSFYMKGINWDVKQCRQCHGTKYQGGLSGITCNTCHTNQNGPEACNTCHGNFRNPGMIAPPQDLKDNSSEIFASVGQHTNHLYNTTIGIAPCSGCHVVPDSVYAPGHITSDTLHLGFGTFATQSDSSAEVIFGDIARNHNPATPAYDKASGNCSNIYCHGSFEFLKSDAVPTNQFAYTADRMSGNNQTVNWINPGNASACGTCHDLPPKGHIPARIQDCVFCHSGVIDENGNIIDQTKHINGAKNARGG